MTWEKLVVRVFEKTTTKEQYRGTAFLINDRYLLTARRVIGESAEKRVMREELGARKNS
ncbi:MAG: hypothetical protein L0Y39_01750 [Methylococcaceae bacterium]|nr:hypothetical protein [Methylococcaceae bacterium]